MDTRDRRLAAMHPALNATWDPATSSWLNLNGWQTEAGAFTHLFHETQIDLSGYAMDSLTFFPTALGMQDPGIYTALGEPGAEFRGLQVLDIVTSVPIKSIAAVANLQFNGTGHAMLGSEYEFETILFGSYRFFANNTTIPYPNYMQLERSQRFDSGEPTAADKLFCYRIVSVLFSGELTPDSLVGIPAARQLIAGQMGDESELVYMQRLKRSYELANQV